jgi:hypothetical protein
MYELLASQRRKINALLKIVDMRRVGHRQQSSGMPNCRLLFANATSKKAGAVMVGGTGIEPVTYAMSTRRSTAELTARK